MSRRPRVPAPFQRLLPSVIKIFGPKLLITGAAVAVLMIGGSSYLLSHSAETPTTSSPKKSLKANNTTDEKSLPTAPEQSPADTSSQPSTNSASEPAGRPSTKENSSSSNAGKPETHKNLLPLCTIGCAGSTVPAEQPSFDIQIHTSSITRGLATIAVPFTITRHGGLDAPVVPGGISVSSGGRLTNLITLQSAIMQSADKGTLTLLTVGLFPHDITVNFAATSGSSKASTSFNVSL